MAAHERSRPWWLVALKVMRTIALAVAAVWAFYVGSINAFLSTPLFDKLVNAQPRTVWIGFERGWSVWPGTIHARRLVLRASDSRVEWLLRVDRVVFDVKFADLIRKRFTARNVKGSTVTFHARTRRPSPELTDDYVAHLPPIPGFGRLPVRSPKPPGPEVWSDEAWHLFSVRLEGVVADDVRDVWIDRQRFEGSARVSGGFDLRPLREVSVGPVTTEVREGHVRLDSQIVADEMKGRLDLTIDRFDPRTVTGAALLERFSALADLRFRAPDLARLPPRATGGARLGGELVVRRLVSSVEHGQRQAGADVDATLASGSFAFRGITARGDVDLRSRSTADGFTADVDVRGAELLGVVAVPRARVSVDGPRIDLARPLRGVHLGVAVPEAHVRDLAALGSPYLRGGSADVTADGELWPDERRARGTAAIRTRALAALGFDGDASATVTAGDLRFGAGAVSRDLSMALRIERGVALVAPRLSLEVAGLTSSAKVARVDLADPLRDLAGEVRFEAASVVDRRSASDARLAGRADLAARDHRLRGTLDLSAPSLAVGFGRWRVAAALRAHASVREWDTSRSTLELDEAAVDLEHVAVGANRPVFAVDRLGLRGSHMALVDRVARGRIVARGEGVSMAGDKVHLRGDVDVDAEVASWDLERNELSLAPSRLSVSNVGGGFSPGTRTDFRVGSVLLSGRCRPIDLARPSAGVFDVRAIVRDAELADARQLAVLLAPGTSVPLESGHARATADLAVSFPDGVARGSVFVAADRARLRVGHVAITGNFGLLAKVNGLDPKTKRLSVTGSRVTARGVEVRGSRVDTSDWAGDLDVLDGSVVLSDPPRADARLRLVADDAAPIVAVTVGDVIPKIFLRRLRARNVEARATLTLAPATAAIRGLEAAGGELRVRGDLAFRGKQVRGAFILQRPVMSAGIAVDDGGASLRLFHLDEWFDERTRENEDLLAQPVR